MSLVERDYVLRMIQLLARAIARILGLKQAGRLEEALEEVQTTADLIFGSMRSTLDAIDPQSAARLLTSGEKIEAYATLTRGTDADGLIELSGQLYVSEKPNAAQGSALAQRMRAAAGVKTALLDWMEIRELEPSLAPIFKSGMLLPNNGRCKNPHQLVTALARAAERNGAAILRGTDGASR